MNNVQEKDLSKDELKGIITNILRTKTENMASLDVREIVQIFKLYMDKFADNIEDNETLFKRHFVEIYPKFTGICDKCNREFDSVPFMKVKCAHCGHIHQKKEGR